MKLITAAAGLLALLCSISGGTPQGEEPKPAYWALLPLASPGSAGHIVVRISPARTAPDGWEMTWFVSVYSPKGCRLPLGNLEDTRELGDASRMVLKIPAGRYRLEVTRPAPSVTGMGHFDLAKGRWISAVQDAMHAGTAEVIVEPGKVKIVELSCQNPQVSSTKEGDRTKTLHLWQNFRMAVSDGQESDVPPRTPVPYPLTRNTSLTALDYVNLVDGLKDKDTKTVAGQALLRVVKPDAGPLLAGLDARSLEMDWYVARVLVQSADARAVSSLSAILRERRGYSWQRAAAAWALGELGDARGSEPLIGALHDPEILVRNYAVLALPKLKNADVFSTLVEATRDTSEPSRGQTLATLGEVPRVYLLSEGATHLDEILPIPNYAVHLNATYALGQLGDPRAVDPLLALLHHKDERVRREAITSLGHYRDPRVVEGLRSRLNDEQATRWLAIQVLGIVGDESVVETLNALAKNDPDKLVREAAAEAVKKLSRKPTPTPPPKKRS